MKTQNDESIDSSELKKIQYPNKKDGKEISLRFNPGQNDLWVDLDEIAELYANDKEKVLDEIEQIFITDELSKADSEIKVKDEQSEELITLYSIDVIISVGYRLDSKRATLFRK